MGATGARDFTASNGDAAGYTLPLNAQGQIGHGGDSGAPDIVTAPNGIGLGIAGVQSTCQPTGYVAGMPQNWSWATGISSCFSAGLEAIRHEILQTIREVPPQFIGTFGTTPPNYQPIWIYAIKNDGDLLWHRKDTGTAPFQGPSRVGNGWAGFADVIPAGGNSFYALGEDGSLNWYRHDGFNDGSFAWKGPVQVGRGWRFSKIFSGSDGIVYAIRDNGELLWYRHHGYASGGGLDTWSMARVVGSGWAQFQDVFSSGSGTIYAIRPDGKLLRYQHQGYATGAPTWSAPRTVGSGWSTFRQVIPVGGGVLLAITPEGKLLWYRFLGDERGTGPLGPVAQDNWEGPVEIGSGWQGFRKVIALLPATPVVAAAAGQTPSALGQDPALDVSGAQDSLGTHLNTGCTGGITGAGGGVIVTESADFYRWSQPGPRPSGRVLTLARRDPARAAALLRAAEQRGLTRVKFNEPANMTCFLELVRGGRRYAVAWPGSGPMSWSSAPRQIRTLAELAEEINAAAEAR